jgi:ATPase family AAA domain-containing protein 3A/B
MGDKSATKTSKGAYGFDPVGLERAAKAAKELDSSPNSKLAFELALKQEETKSVEAQAQIKQLDMQRIRFEQEQKRLTMEKELEISKQKSLMDHELARERYREQLADVRKRAWLSRSR